MRNLTDLFAELRRRGTTVPSEPLPPNRCTRCGGLLDGAELYQRLRVCPYCRHHGRLGVWRGGDFGPADLLLALVPGRG